MIFRAILGVILMFCLSLGVQAAGKEDDWLEAFGHLEAGTRHWELREYQEAAEEYRQGMGHFREIHIRYPAWRTDVVLFRWAYCKAKLAECQKHLDKPLAAMGRQELEDELQTARDANSRLLEKLDGLAKDVTSLADTEKENARLKAELNERKKALSLAERKADRLIELAEENQRLKQELGRLLAEYEDYKESIKNAEHRP